MATSPSVEASSRSALLGHARQRSVVRYRVLKGQLKQAGMVSFDKNLSHDDAAAIRAYVIFRANQILPRRYQPPR